MERKKIGPSAQICFPHFLSIHQLLKWKSKSIAFLKTVKSKLLTTRGLDLLLPTTLPNKGLYFGDPNQSRQMPTTMGLFGVWPNGHFVRGTSNFPVSCRKFLSKNKKGLTGSDSIWCKGNCCKVFDGDPNTVLKGCSIRKLGAWQIYYEWWTCKRF